MSLATKAKTARQRASIAANMINKNLTFGRVFDDCFEMFDGDEVMNFLIEKTAKDPVLARNIKEKMPGLGYGDFNVRLHQAIERALGNNLVERDLDAGDLQNHRGNSVLTFKIDA